MNQLAMNRANHLALLILLLASPLSLHAAGEEPSALHSESRTELMLDSRSPGRTFDGIGGLSAGASSRMLYDYPEPQRSQILDFLFKPKFGASFQNLKVEIGGDVNSTCGTEPSQARTRDEFDHPKREYFQRGYEWWLMKEARKRNPDIMIGVLQWGAPGWMGDAKDPMPDDGQWKQVAHRKFYTADNAQFIADFIKAARDIHGVRVDYAGVWNENAYNVQWIKLLRRTLDQNGLKQVKLVAADNTGPGGWGIASEMQKDPELMRAVDVVGAHYPGKCPERVGREKLKIADASLCEDFASRPYALETGKPLWSSEDGPWRNAWSDIPYLMKSYIRNYVDGRITSTIIWPVITCQPAWTRHGDAGPMRAAQPWCGYYEVQDAIWVTAQFTQFAAPGWRYLDQACGRLPGKGSYVTLLKPGPEGDYSIILETHAAKEPQELTVRLGNGLSRGKLNVWTSDAAERFVRRTDIVPEGDSFKLRLAPGSIVSLSTIGGQQKGAVADLPESKPFPFPYKEDFESYARGSLAKYFADQSGSFEVASRADGQGRCYRQMVPQRGIWWHYPNPEPATFLGDAAWTDYAVNCDVLIEGRGSVALYGRIVYAVSINYKSALPPQGCWFSITDEGDWKIFMANSKNSDVCKTELAHGICAFSSDRWHRLRLEFQGKRIRAFVDGVKVGTALNANFKAGVAGFGSGWNHARFDNFAIEALP